MATTSSSIRSVLVSFYFYIPDQSVIRLLKANNEEGAYGTVLCGRISQDDNKLGPYISQGPRIVVIFSSTDGVNTANWEQRRRYGLSSSASGEIEPPKPWPPPYGFRACVEFKTGKLVST